MATDWQIEFRVEPSFEEGFVVCIASGPAQGDDCLVWIQRGHWIELLPSHELCGSPPRRISCSDGHAIHAALLKTKISVAPPPIVGVDGTTHTLSISGLFNKAIYKWWSYLPEGWAELSPIVETLTSYVLYEPVTQVDASMPNHLFKRTPDGAA